MSHGHLIGNSRRVYRVDAFKVPVAARAEFLDRVFETHDLLRGVLGFVEDIVLEQSLGPGRSRVATIVVWRDQEAIEPARAVVAAMRKESGFDPQVMFARLGIEVHVGRYHELVHPSPGAAVPRSVQGESGCEGHV